MFFDKVRRRCVKNKEGRVAPTAAPMTKKVVSKVVTGARKYAPTIYAMFMNWRSTETIAKELGFLIRTLLER